MNVAPVRFGSSTLLASPDFGIERYVDPSCVDPLLSVAVLHYEGVKVLSLHHVQPSFSLRDFHPDPSKRLPVLAEARRRLERLVGEHGMDRSLVLEKFLSKGASQTSAPYVGVLPSGKMLTISGQHELCALWVGAMERLFPESWLEAVPLPIYGLCHQLPEGLFLDLFPDRGTLTWRDLLPTVPFIPEVQIEDRPDSASQRPELFKKLLDASRDSAALLFLFSEFNLDPTDPILDELAKQKSGEGLCHRPGNAVFDAVNYWRLFHLIVSRLSNDGDRFFWTKMFGYSDRQLYEKNPYKMMERVWNRSEARSVMAEVLKNHKDPYLQAFVAFLVRRLMTDSTFTKRLPQAMEWIQGSLLEALEPLRYQIYLLYLALFEAGDTRRAFLPEGVEGLFEEGFRDYENAMTYSDEGAQAAVSSDSHLEFAPMEEGSYLFPPPALTPAQRRRFKKATVDAGIPAYPVIRKLLDHLRRIGSAEEAVAVDHMLQRVRDLVGNQPYYFVYWGSPLEVKSGEALSRALAKRLSEIPGQRPPEGLFEFMDVRLTKRQIQSSIFLILDDAALTGDQVAQIIRFLGLRGISANRVQVLLEAATSYALQQFAELGPKGCEAYYRIPTIGETFTREEVFELEKLLYQLRKSPQMEVWDSWGSGRVGPILTFFAHKVPDSVPRALVRSEKLPFQIKRGLWLIDDRKIAKKDNADRY